MQKLIEGGKSRFSTVVVAVVWFRAELVCSGTVFAVGKEWLSLSF